MNKNKIYINISNIFSFVAFAIVLIFLIGLVIMENGIFYSGIIDTNYEILDYDMSMKVDKNSPTEVINEYTIDIGGLKNDETNIAFYTKHQYCKVYVGDELVCSITPKENFDFAKTIGSNWVMFKVNKDDIRKEIRVILTPAYDDVISTDLEFVKGSAFSIFYRIFINNMPQCILGLIAIIIGLLFSIISLFRIIRKKEFFTIFMWGLFSLFLGIWRLFDSQLISFLFYKKPLFIYYVVVTMLTICPIPFLYALKSETDKLWRKIYDILCVIVAFVSISQIILQSVYNIDVRSYLSVYHNFLLICVIIVFIGEIYHKIKKYKRTNVIHEYLPIVCIISVVLDLLVYILTNDTSRALFTISSFIIYISFSGILLLREYNLKEIKLENELKQSKVTLSLSQIQPHFIYNTLSSIRYLCKTDADLAQESLDSFSTYLRCNIDSLQNSDVIPFTKELSFIETYVKLEQLRFGDKIEMIYELEEKDFYIPSLTIQPLVENAIKHGITVKEEGGKVILRTEKINNEINISIIDDGVGFSTAQDFDDTDSHIGLQNVKYRLKYFLESDLIINSNEQGTKIIIKIKDGKKGGK